MNKAPNVKSEIYEPDGRGHVSTAKAQFAEEHDVPYEDLQGSKVGRYNNYIVVIYND